MTSPSSTIIVPSLVLLPRSAQFGNFFAPYGWANTTNKKRRDYGIRITPLHSHLSVDGLIEFMELSQVLGSSHFTFYDFVSF